MNQTQEDMGGVMAGYTHGRFSRRTSTSVNPPRSANYMYQHTWKVFLILYASSCDGIGLARKFGANPMFSQSQMIQSHKVSKIQY